MKALFFSNPNYPAYSEAKEIVESCFTVVEHLDKTADLSDIDVVISVFNPKILEERYLNRPNVNIHSAPKWYRGLGGLAKAIYSNKTCHGAVSHAMTLKIDAGSIYSTREFGIEKNIKFDELRIKTEMASLDLLKEFCLFFKGNGRVPHFSNEQWEGTLGTKIELMKWLENTDLPEKEIIKRYYSGVW